MPSDHILGAYWPARRELIMQCCDRLAGFMGELAQCDPALEFWYELVELPKQRPGKRVDIKDRPSLMKLLEGGRNRRDIGGEVIEELGFHFGLWNGADDDRATGLSITCGLYWKSPTPNVSLSNCVVWNSSRKSWRAQSGREHVEGVGCYRGGLATGLGGSDVSGCDECAEF